MKKIINLIFIILYLVSNPVFAGVEGEMHSFLDNMGFANNVSSAGAYNSQHAGYYTAGQVYSRTGVKDMSLAHLQLPGYKAGCGGIDLHFGSFSFLNGGLVDFGKKVLQNASGVAFDYFLQQHTPALYNNLKNNTFLTQLVNGASINSCEVATQMVGGIASRVNAADKLACEGDALRTGDKSDHFQARQACGAGGEREARLAKASPEFKDSLGSKYNLMWKALQKNPFFQSDTELAEFVMSLTGTIVVTRETSSSGDTTYKTLRYPAKVENENIHKILMDGGSVSNIYSCDNTDSDGCLNLGKKSIKISQNRAFRYKIEKLMNQIVTKAINAEALNTEEEAFINSSNKPVMRIVQISAAGNRADLGTITVVNVSEYLAYSYLLTFLDSVIDQALKSVQHLQAVQDNNQILAEFISSVHLIRRELSSKKNRLEANLNQQLDFTEKLQLENSRIIESISEKNIMTRGQ